MFIVILENIRSVYNVGSIFRSMEGFGLKKAVLIGITPAPLDKKGEKRKDFIKTALGAEDRIEWQYFETSEESYDILKPSKIISLEKNENSLKLWDSKILKESRAEDGRENIFLVLGSEVEGVSDFFLSKSDEILEIPMEGTKESFNVSVSAGTLFYELKRMDK